jgi:hypothetical protein
MTDPTIPRTPETDDAELYRPSLIERIAMIVAMLLILVFLADCLASTVHSQASRWTQDDGLLAAQACVSEATWDGASSTSDCGGIIQVVEARRGEHETFAAALRRTMPRFFGGRTDRIWALHLPFGPIVRNPEGWPYTYGAAHHSRQWAAVMARVHGYMREGVPLPCSPAPISWLGRETDGHVLADRLSSGAWLESSCGETRNAFIYQVDLE